MPCRLTDPSSATAHGEVDVEYGETPTAMSRSLERVVRRLERRGGGEWILGLPA